MARKRYKPEEIVWNVRPCTGITMHMTATRLPRRRAAI